jgi:hypothetical protein
MVDYLAVTPDEEAPQRESPATRSWLSWLLVSSSFAAMVAAALAAFTPFSVSDGPVTFQCARPMALAFAPDVTGECRWSVAQSRCTLALVLSLLGVVLVAVALIRLVHISHGEHERFMVGLGQLLLLGLTGVGCLALIGLSIAALAVGPGINQGI